MIGIEKEKKAERRLVTVSSNSLAQIRTQPLRKGKYMNRSVPRGKHR
jgi:hypothetical protein